MNMCLQRVITCLWATGGDSHPVIVNLSCRRLGWAGGSGSMPEQSGWVVACTRGGTVHEASQLIGLVIAYHS